MCGHLLSRHKNRARKSACDCCLAGTFKGNDGPLHREAPDDIAHYSKWCTKCAKLKKLRDYPIRSNGKFLSWCRECTNSYKKGTKKPDGHRHALLKKYGLTVDDYDRMRAEQNYRCAICGIHEDELAKNTVKKDRRLHIDHCHDTLKVRSLLCAGCNSGLSRFFDSAPLLFKAFMYVQEWDEKERQQQPNAA